MRYVFPWEQGGGGWLGLFWAYCLFQSPDSSPWMASQKISRKCATLPRRLPLPEVILLVTPDGFFTNVPREYIIILNCFQTFPLFAPWPRRMVRGQSGRAFSRVFNRHVPRTNRSFVWFAKGRYLLQASVVFCAKFYLPPYKCCLPSVGRVSLCRSRTASRRIRGKLCGELSFAI